MRRGSSRPFFYGNLQPISMGGGAMGGGGAMTKLQNFSDSSFALTDGATRTLSSNTAIPDQRGGFFDGWPRFSTWLAFSTNRYYGTRKRRVLAPGLYVVC